MSAFTGAVVLTGEGCPKQLDVFPPPDERGLDRGRSLGSAISVVIRRQRVVSPQDRIERQPMSAWGGAGWVAFAGRLDDRADLTASLGATLPRFCPMANSPALRSNAGAPKRRGDFWATMRSPPCPASRRSSSSRRQAP